MASESTYKPKGTILPSYEDSAMQKLKAIAQPVFDEFKSNGKVDANALNDLAKTQNENLSKIVEYFLELVNKQSDTTTDKIKYELQNLASSLAKDQQTSEKSVDEIETRLSDDDIKKLKQTLKEEFNSAKSDKQQTSNLASGPAEIVDIKTHVSTEVSNLQQYISKQLDSLQKNISGLRIRLPKLSFPKLSFPSIKSFAEKLKNFKLPKFKFPKFKFPKLKLPKFKFPKLKLPKFKFPKLKLPKLQPFKKIKALGSKVKNVASKAKNAVVKPFAAIGGFFKKLAFGSNSKFTFPKLRKFLINFFSFKNVAKWITGFLKKQVKVFQNMVAKIIKPIKAMIFGAIKMLLSGIGRLLFIYLGPIAIAAWTILALVTLLVVGIVLLVVWIKNNWKRIVNFVKSLPSKIWKGIKWISGKIWDGLKWIGKQVWSGIKWLGKMVWKGIRFIFFDMWVMLGKWIWKKLVQFGNWLWKKIKGLGKWLKTTIIDPVVGWFKKNVIDRIKNTAFYKKVSSFINSVGNLVERIKGIWTKFKWDENKTFLENLMTFWENIKSAIKDWWKSSPIKTYYDKLVNWLTDMVKPIKDWWENSELKKKYDQYIQPLIDNLSDLKKAIFSAFSWDSSKGFFENLIGIWDNLKEKVSAWWSTSQFKTYYDKLVNWLTDMVKPIKDWWNSLEIGKKLSDMFEYVKELPTKVWEKIKGLFGKAGEIAGNTWNWIKNKVSGSKDTKDEKEFTVDEAVEALNKERTRTMEIDVGTIKDILDMVTNISDILVKTIVVKLDQLIGNVVTTQPIQTYTINKNQQVLNNIVNSEDIDTTIDSNQEQQFGEQNKKLDNIGQFMSKFAYNVNQNFELILQKLDEKPNLLPIPFANTDVGNAALMENMR